MALIPQSFSFENITLNFYSFTHPRTGKVWVTGNDIAKGLGYKNPADAIYKNVKNPTFKSKWNDLIGDVSISQVPKNWQKNTMMINEGGMNRLITACRFESVDRFRDWVCSTILPTIRKTDLFIVDDKMTHGFIESRRACIQTDQHLENTKRDAVNMRRDSMDAIRDTVNAIRDAVVQDIVSKPATPELRHVLTVHELHSESKEIAFTRKRNPQARELYNVDYVPNGVNVFNCVKECLKKENVPYLAQNNVIKMLKMAESSEEVVNVIREGIARPKNCILRIT